MTPCLMDYENTGVCEEIAGLFFAGPYGHKDEERHHLHEEILERIERYSFPVVADMDFGHTSPIFTLPIGCRGLIDVDAKRFAMTEAAVI